MMAWCDSVARDGDREVLTTADIEVIAEEVERCDAVRCSARADTQCCGLGSGLV